LDALTPLLHDDLKRLARRHLTRERVDHTIQPTALVNEAFMRLTHERRMRCADRGHFLAVAAKLMRFILVDYARRRGFQRRGGGLAHVPLDSGIDVADKTAPSVIAVDEALSSLAKIDERKAQVVELRVFAGLTCEESARLLSVSPGTVARDWRFARAWLRRELTR
jgi:RNA polymerase sigma-70 factor, ECF subfamily